MNIKQQLRKHIEHIGSPIRMVEITRQELERLSEGLEGRYGWLTPIRVTGAEAAWRAPVCVEVIEEHLSGLDPRLADVYLNAIGYWLHSHVSQIIDGNHDFTSREAQIEAELLDVSPAFVRLVSEVQMGILDKAGND